MPDNFAIPSSASGANADSSQESILWTRQVAHELTLSELIAKDLISAHGAGVLSELIKKRARILFYGAAGTGKTTLANALTAQVPLGATVAQVGDKLKPLSRHGLVPLSEAPSKTNNVGRLDDALEAIKKSLQDGSGLLAAIRAGSLTEALKGFTPQEAKEFDALVELRKHKADDGRTLRYCSSILLQDEGVLVEHENGFIDPWGKISWRQSENVTQQVSRSVEQAIKRDSIDREFKIIIGKTSKGEEFGLSLREISGNGLVAIKAEEEDVIASLAERLINGLALPSERLSIINLSEGASLVNFKELGQLAAERAGLQFSEVCTSLNPFDALKDLNAKDSAKIVSHYLQSTDSAYYQSLTGHIVQQVFEALLQLQATTGSVSPFEGKANFPGVINFLIEHPHSGLSKLLKVLKGGLVSSKETSDITEGLSIGLQTLLKQHDLTQLAASYEENRTLEKGVTYSGFNQNESLRTARAGLAGTFLNLAHDAEKYPTTLIIMGASSINFSAELKSFLEQAKSLNVKVIFFESALASEVRDRLPAKNLNFLIEGNIQERFDIFEPLVFLDGHDGQFPSAEDFRLSVSKPRMRHGKGYLAN